MKPADKDALIDIIVSQQAINEWLERRVAQLEGQAKSSGSRRMPSPMPKADCKPDQPRKPRQRRPHALPESA